MKKAKDTDKAYAEGVKAGFLAGISKSIELIYKSIEENNSNNKYSLLGKAALTIFSRQLIIELTKFIKN